MVTWTCCKLYPMQRRGCDGIRLGRNPSGLPDRAPLRRSGTLGGMERRKCRSGAFSATGRTDRWPPPPQARGNRTRLTGGAVEKPADLRGDRQVFDICGRSTKRVASRADHTQNNPFAVFCKCLRIVVDAVEAVFDKLLLVRDPEALLDPFDPGDLILRKVTDRKGVQR